MENTLQHIFSTDYDQDTFFSGVLEYVFGAENITKQEYPEEFISSDADRNLAQAANILSIKKVGGIEGFFNEFSIFDITLGDDSKIAYSRVNIQNVLRKKLYGENAFLLFHYQNPEGKEWRLSYLYSYGKASTDSKRYTYLLGSQHNARTVTERFTKLKNDLVFLKDDENKSKDLLEEAFSVEALTKEFYNRLFEWYQWAVLPETKVSFPNLVNTQSDDRDDIDTKIIRLITRLMFVWFIKQKQLVPNRIFDTTYLKTILKDFDPQSRTNGNYYNAILQNLFFAT
ncbi:MAG: hypothetical protein IKB95_00820, partial [Bacteroidales bacterium]|nr:hypothetical protein [Bacteroidales bacterium]